MDLLRDTSLFLLDGGRPAEKLESVWMKSSLFLWRFSSNMPSTNCATLSSWSSSKSSSISSCPSEASTTTFSLRGLSLSAFFFFFLRFFFLLGEETIHWSEGERPRASMERRAARRARTHQSVLSAGRWFSSSSDGSGLSAVDSSGSAPKKSSCHCGVARKGASLREGRHQQCS